jgi:hypothetical protein
LLLLLDLLLVLALLVLLLLLLAPLPLLALLVLLLLLRGAIRRPVLLLLLAGRTLLAFRPVPFFAVVVFFALIVVLCVGRSNGSAQQQHRYCADKKEFHNRPRFCGANYTCTRTTKLMSRKPLAPDQAGRGAPSPVPRLSAAPARRQPGTFPALQRPRFFGIV